MTLGEYKKIFLNCSFINDFKKEYKRIGHERDKKTVDEYLESKCAAGWIMDAFCWSSTNQGGLHWKEIHIAWGQFVRDGDLRCIYKWYMASPVKDKTEKKSHTLNFKL